MGTIYIHEKSHMSGGCAPGRDSEGYNSLDNKRLLPPGWPSITDAVTTAGSLRIIHM